MSANISELSRLYLWSLLLSGGQNYVLADEIQLPDEISERLEKAGLIERAQQAAGLFFKVTSNGQQWLSSQMLEMAQPGSPLAAEVLNKLMSCLHQRLRLDGVSLQQWLHVPVEDSNSDWLEEINLDLEFEEQSSGDHLAIPEQVRRAYLELSERRFNVAVKIPELRKKLPELSTSEVDSALMLMELEGQVWFATIEDPQERKAEDANALLYVSGMVRDLVYLEK